MLRVSSITPEVVIVGAGVAGSALAIMLGRRGYRVLLLEKSLVHTDRVRGEVLVPWGVAEVQKLDLVDGLVAGGAHFTTRAISYAQGIEPEIARSRARDQGGIVPGVKGSLNLGHPKICEALNEEARRLGVALLRGVERIEVAPGPRPSIAFVHGGERTALSPRLIVGADGRGSTIAKQMGARVFSDPVHHFLSGLLVDGLDEWPINEQSSGNIGDIGYYLFPQSHGRARLYAAHGLEQKSRFAGSGGSQRFIEAFDHPAMPYRTCLKQLRPAGPCHGYANNDVWLDQITAPGVVLIGDAAGTNDPSIAQGLSLSFRDVRLVSDALAHGLDKSADGLAAYADERRRRMSRYRMLGQLVGKIRFEFTNEAHARRQRIAARMASEPELAFPQIATSKGYEAVPDHVYTDEYREWVLR